ncbi:hypothetical protein ACTXT7_013272 [Hymenolepis weldensis]
MSKLKTSDKKGPKDVKQYEKIERKHIGVTVYVVGDPGMVNCSLCDVGFFEVIHCHRPTEIVTVLRNAHYISIMDGNNGRGGAGSSMVLAVCDVGDCRTVDYLRQDVIPKLRS